MLKEAKMEDVSAGKAVSIDEVEEYAEKGANVDDIGRILGVSPKDWKILRSEKPEIEEAIQRGKARLRLSILSFQLEKAQKGDARILVWLGKQYLGQSEKAGEQTEVVSFEREKEAVRQAVRKDPNLIKTIFSGAK